MEYSIKDLFLNRSSEVEILAVNTVKIDLSSTVRDVYELSIVTEFYIIDRDAAHSQRSGVS